MLGTPPLAVVVIAHQRSWAREGVMEQLFRRLCRDPDSLFATSSAVPVVGGEIGPNGELFTPVEAARAAVLVLLDEEAATDDTFLDRLDALTAAGDSATQRVFVVPLCEVATKLRRPFAQTNFLRLTGEAPPWTELGSALVHELCRWLVGRPRWGGPTTGASSEAPVTVFLSHAKRDHGLELAKQFREHLHQNTQLDSFFDAHDIGPGFPFPDEIARAIEHCSILLVFRSDAYGSREWCQREVLLAKRSGVAIVVADAFRGREHRSFPYLGNVPTIRYEGDPAGRDALLAVLLDEALRQLHFKERVRRVLPERARHGALVWGAAPELVRFALERERQATAPDGAKRAARLVVYPDPPLSAPELALLAFDAQKIRARSLTECVAGKLTVPDGFRVQLSTSEAGDERELALVPLHQQDLVVELTRHLLVARIQVVYGGDLRALGFTERVVEVQRSRVALTGVGAPRIRSYLAAPLPATEREPYADAVEFVPPPLATVPLDAPATLRVVRERMAEETNALVAIGGRTSGFGGWRPGVVEEIAAAVGRGRPVYLVGGFGGAVHALTRAVFFGEDPPTFEANPALGPEPAAERAPPTNEVVGRLRRDGPRNGLSKKDNRRLALSVDADEIVGLVLRGLARLTRRA